MVLKSRVFILGLVALLFLIQSCSKEFMIDRNDKCWQGFLNSFQAGILESDFQKQLVEFQILVERNYVLREQMQKRLVEIEDKEVLSPQDLKDIRLGTIMNIEIRDKMMEIAQRYECLINVGIEMSSDSSLVKLTANNDFAINPVLGLKLIMLSLSSALTLYDNYLLVLASFHKNEKLRRLINSPDVGFEIESGELRSIIKKAGETNTRKRIKEGLEFYETAVETLLGIDEHSKALASDNDFEYLSLLIQQSPSYSYILEGGLFSFGIIRKFINDGTLTWDTLDKINDAGVNEFSKTFGNFVGILKTSLRNGKLYGREDVAKILTSKLQPLDILLEKTPFRLTDKFIPGHFGHVAIWVGTEEDLKNYQIWDNPVVEKAHEDIKNGKYILEALRSGVELNTIEHFLDIDDVVILRPMVYGPFSSSELFEEKRKTLIQAFRQYGKEYDFNFDVQTTDKIVCSELAYVTFTSPALNSHWPVDPALGRYTISPANVAKLALDGVPLELITFYHDGELVPAESQNDLFKELIATPPKKEFIFNRLVKSVWKIF